MKTVQVSIDSVVEPLALDAKTVKTDTKFIPAGAPVPSVSVTCYCGKTYDLDDKPAECEHAEQETQIVYERVVRGNGTRKLNVRAQVQELVLGERYR
ncbi:hypothetical protein HY493_04300 [Candidatus Woesearchaeota archaeon]|nr:hypothetical protein [Candidatus Woesearchaeota archaeon]